MSIVLLNAPIRNYYNRYMENILQLAQQNAQQAFAMLRQSRAVTAWDLQGAEVHIVGSLACGLYFDSHDIDLHVYTDPFDMEDAFAAMAMIAQQKGFKRLTCQNLLDTPEACVEWHVFFEDERGQEWNLDIIHIMRSSRYDGYFEKQAAAIKEMLTDDTRTAILNIKKARPKTPHIGGIWIYTAVLRDGVRTAEQFNEWYAKQDKNQILCWPLKK